MPTDTTPAEFKLKEFQQVILRQSGINKPRAALAAPFLGAFALQPSARVEQLNLEVGRLSAKDFNALRRQEDVASIAPSVPVQLVHPLSAQRAAEPEDVAWGVRAVRADMSPYTGAGVTIAVLDTGIADHPAFEGVDVVQKDFTGEGDGDGHGHGTHCAGTILGRDVEGSRIGVARGVTRLLVGKVLGNDGDGDTEGVFRGLQWAINEGAHVISMSLGISFPHLVKNLRAEGLPELAAVSVGLEAYRANLRMFDAVLKLMEARARSLEHPVLLVAASGNESNLRGEVRSDEAAYRIFAAPPAAADGAVAVGAVDQAMKVAPFSNARPSVVAPGVAVVSAWPSGELKALAGTSMAAPHVAGVAALYAQMLMEKRNFTASTFVAHLIAGAEHYPLASPFHPVEVGAGLIQAPVTPAA